MIESELGKLLITSDDKRKGVIFTYFVGVVWVIAAVNALQNLYFSLTIEGAIGQEYSSYNPTNFAFLILLGLIWLGHRWFPQLMRHAFMVLIVVSAIFTFELEDISAALVVLTIPIIMAAFLIRPIYGFVYYLVIAATYALKLELEGYSLLDENVVPFMGLVTLIVFAVVAWLIALSLERALGEARTLNRELEQSCVDRAREV